MDSTRPLKTDPLKTNGASLAAQKLACSRLIGRFSRYDKKVFDMSDEEYGDYSKRELRVVRRRLLKKCEAELDKISPNAKPVAVKILSDCERAFTDLSNKSAKSRNAPTNQTNILVMGNANINRNDLVSFISSGSLPTLEGQISPEPIPEHTPDTNRPVQSHAALLETG